MNIALFEKINAIVGFSQYSDAAIVFFAQYLPWILVAGLVWYFYRRWNKGLRIRREMLFVCLSISVSSLLSSLIKYYFNNPRPFVFLTQTRTLFLTGGSDAFPSAHAAVFFSAAFAMMIINKRWGMVYLIGAFLISISRVIAGVHWPLDILGGFLIGLIVSYLADLAKKRTIRRT